MKPDASQFTSIESTDHADCRQFLAQIISISIPIPRVGMFQIIYICILSITNDSSILCMFTTHFCGCVDLVYSMCHIDCLSCADEHIYVRSRSNMCRPSRGSCECVCVRMKLSLNIELNTILGATHSITLQSLPPDFDFKCVESLRVAKVLI